MVSKFVKPRIIDFPGRNDHYIFWFNSIFFESTNQHAKRYRIVHNGEGSKRALTYYSTHP